MSGIKLGEIFPQSTVAAIVETIIMRHGIRIILGLLLIIAITPPQVRSQEKAKEYKAAALGVTYQLVPYGQAFGAKLTRAPEPNSPAAKLMLEPGDMLISLDNLPIRGPQDVTNHIDQTTIVFINIQTNQPQTAVVTLPAQVIADGPVTGNAPATTAQQTLRRVASTMVRGREIKYAPMKIVEKGNTLFWELPNPDFETEVSSAEYQQFLVEIIRANRSSPTQRAFWEPYLQRIESEIAESIKSESVKPDDKQNDLARMAEQDGPIDRIHEIYVEAMKANAAIAGKISKEIPPSVAAPIFQVKLITPNNQGKVYLMPRTRFRIRELSLNKMPALSEFDQHEPGIEIGLSGRYVYKIIFENGAELPRGTVGNFMVSSGGTIRLK
jgi:hypothetical protein